MNNSGKRYRFLKWLAAILAGLALLAILFRMAVMLDPPPVELAPAIELERTGNGEDRFTCEKSWLKKNRYGLWEMYLEGSDFELGVKHGKLARELVHYQEEVFVEQIRQLIPSENYLKFLKFVVVWMNRKMDKHVPLEYQREIYGVSLAASADFRFIGPDYLRFLNYHAAHDIGHALQNMNLVACTAFGVKGERSEDGHLLVGRNFDFSMGDDFARNKIVAFYAPEKGYRFASVTWGGMIGVVSGMNERGLAVTLNAAKSGMPTSSKTPTSILARRILQYAGTIDEAYAIAGESETFVAESFLISSARDHRTVVIEKSPDKMDMYDPGGDVIILTNHFQGDLFKDSELTIQNKREGASLYRWERARELLEKKEKHDVHSFARVLRDRYGKGDQPIGMGNERAVNQLVAHHSIIFKPDQLKMWVSVYPYSLGTYLCYDLNRVFADTTGLEKEVYLPWEGIPEDPFLNAEGFALFKTYKRETARLKRLVEGGKVERADTAMINAYLALNPHYYYPYFVAGEYYRVADDPISAIRMYRASLEREIPRVVDREVVEEALTKIKHSIK
jgi:hypothetical protein